MSRKKTLQLPSTSSSSCSDISSYFKSQQIETTKKSEKPLKLSTFVDKNSNLSENKKSPQRSIINFLNLSDDFETTPAKKIKKAPAPRKRKKEPATKKQPKIKSALLKQEEALSEAITYHSLSEDVDPDELRLALAISRSEAEAQGLPVDDLESLKQFEYKKQTNRSKKNGGFQIPTLTYRDPEVAQKKIQEKFSKILENIDINLNLPGKSEDSLEAVHIFTSTNLCGLVNHKKFFNKHENSETVEDLNDYYVTDLFEPSTVKAGHLLKSYKSIIGRESYSKKNVEPKVYKLLDDDEILRRIENSGNIEIQNIQECVEIVHKNMKVKEHFENKNFNMNERAGEDFKKMSPSRSLEKIENENSNFNEKHKDNIEKLSPCSSPLEKRKKFENEHEHNFKKLSPYSSPLEKCKNLERIVTSPDLFCDSDDDVEMVCNEEENFKSPPAKNPTQLFGSEDDAVRMPSKNLASISTLGVNTNDEDIFDLTLKESNEEFKISNAEENLDISVMMSSDSQKYDLQKEDIFALNESPSQKLLPLNVENISDEVFEESVICLSDDDDENDIRDEILNLSQDKTLEKLSNPEETSKGNDSFEKEVDIILDSPQTCKQINSPVLGFEELRAKYGLLSPKKDSSRNDSSCVKKSISQPIPKMDDEDFFDEFCKSSFKKRPIVENNTNLKIQKIETKSQMNQIKSLTQPPPSSSKQFSKDETELEINGKVYIVNTENIPEKPDYANMDMETLNSHLKKYGLKPMTETRKRAVALLDYIFNQMHPLVVEESDQE